MKIYLGGDHAGLQLKDKVKAVLAEWGYEVKDFGPFEFNNDDDYPDFVKPVAEAVAKEPENSRGILFGGSGQGEAMVANRYKKIRATVFYGGPEDIVSLSRQHNNANILSIGVRFIEEKEAMRVIKMWLEAKFPAEERHKRRIDKF
ncbi:MAG: ribose 5-phosphate isomerase B [Parcubacteria group bacterium Gr01-1014_19]|nr:MAG: ribose 5-phosphate isomerase B [Parcubacteria group bacterium Gr01-1014_19]